MIDNSAPLSRRYGAMAYEGVLLFGVSFISAYLFDTLTQSRSALMYRHAREIWLFLVYGIYFVYLWSHGGQTLAMKTWRIRLVMKDGAPVSTSMAALRYCCSWIFILIGAGLAKWFDLSPPLMATALAASIILPPLLMLGSSRRQFVYDLLLGTRLVTVERPDAGTQTPTEA